MRGSGPLTAPAWRTAAVQASVPNRVDSAEEGHSMTSSRFLSLVGAFPLCSGACGGQGGGPSPRSGATIGTGGTNSSGGSSGTGTGGSGTAGSPGTGGADSGTGGQAVGGRGAGGASTGGSSGGGGGGAGGTGGTSAPVPSKGCGVTNGAKTLTTGGMSVMNALPTSTRLTMASGGMNREYIIDIPADYDPTHPYRLIFSWYQAFGSDTGNANGLHPAGDGPNFDATHYA